MCCDSTVAPLLVETGVCGYFKHCKTRELQVKPIWVLFRFPFKIGQILQRNYKLALLSTHPWVMHLGSYFTTRFCVTYKGSTTFLTTNFKYYIFKIYFIYIIHLLNNKELTKQHIWWECPASITGLGRKLIFPMFCESLKVAEETCHMTTWNNITSPSLLPSSYQHGFTKVWVASL